jgi:O-acetylserine/cysteine efflux transporter
MSSRLAVLALVVAAASWGLATSCTKYALAGLSAFTLLAAELVAATAALWICLLIRGYRPPASWRLAITLGVLEPGLAYLGETIGLAHTSASNAALIFGLESAFVVVLAAIFLRERISFGLGLAIVVAVIGLVVLVGSPTMTGPRLGDLFVLAGALTAASYTIVARYAGQELDALAFTAHQFGFATLLVTPAAGVAWLTGTEQIPVSVAPRFWVAAALVGIVGFAASFVLYNYAIVRMEAGPASVIINLIPAFALVSAVVWLGESLTPSRLAGVGLITASVAAFSWSEFLGSRQVSGPAGLSRSRRRRVPRSCARWVGRRPLPVGNDADA